VEHCVSFIIGKWSILNSDIMPRAKNDNIFRRPFNPKYSRGKTKMWDDCVVLLTWASRNRNAEVSISILSEATGIPRMTLHWIITDVTKRKGNSILARAAQHYGYEYVIYSTWNTRDAHKRKKKIIDAVKISERMSD
jgi:hypothetical protein